MVVASPGNLCKINLNKRQRLRHFLNHKGIRSRFKCTSQSCAYDQFSVQLKQESWQSCEVSTTASFLVLIKVGFDPVIYSL